LDAGIFTDSQKFSATLAGAGFCRRAGRHGSTAGGTPAATFPPANLSFGRRNNYTIARQRNLTGKIIDSPCLTKI
jgi:hypothetical protein